MCLYKGCVCLCQIWPSVKAQHQNLSVCEIGATIGRMWRELKDEQKQKYNDDFTQAKVSIARGAPCQKSV